MITAKFEEYKNDNNEFCVNLMFYGNSKLTNDLNTWAYLITTGVETIVQKDIDSYYEKTKKKIYEIIQHNYAEINKVLKINPNYVNNFKYMDLYNKNQHLFNLLSAINSQFQPIETNAYLQRHIITKFLADNNFKLNVLTKSNDHKKSYFDFNGNETELISKIKLFNSNMLEQIKTLRKTKLCEANNYLETIGVNQLIKNYKSAVKETEEQTENEK